MKIGSVKSTVPVKFVNILRGSFRLRQKVVVVIILPIYFFIDALQPCPVSRRLIRFQLKNVDLFVLL